MAQCEGPGENGEQCKKTAVRAGICEGHRWQKRHKGVLTPLQSREGGAYTLKDLESAALDLAEADSDNDADHEAKRQRLFRISAEVSRTIRPRVPESIKAAVRAAVERGAGFRETARRFAISDAEVRRLCRGMAAT